MHTFPNIPKPDLVVECDEVNIYLCDKCKDLHLVLLCDGEEIAGTSLSSVEMIDQAIADLRRARDQMRGRQQ